MDQMQSVYIVQQLLTPSQLQRNATTALMRCASTANQSQKRLVRKKSLIMCVTDIGSQPRRLIGYALILQEASV